MEDDDHAPDSFFHILAPLIPRSSVSFGPLFILSLAAPGNRAIAFPSVDVMRLLMSLSRVKGSLSFSLLALIGFVGFGGDQGGGEAPREDVTQVTRLAGHVNPNVSTSTRNCKEEDGGVRGQGDEVLHETRSSLRIWVSSAQKFRSCSCLRRSRGKADPFLLSRWMAEAAGEPFPSGKCAPAAFPSRSAGGGRKAFSSPRPQATP